MAVANFLILTGRAGEMMLARLRLVFEIRDLCLQLLVGSPQLVIFGLIASQTTLADLKLFYSFLTRVQLLGERRDFSKEFAVSRHQPA